jgi:hypothetical protein
MKAQEKSPKTYFKSIENDYEGNQEDLLKQFFNRVKPKNGTIKYHMSKWSEYPKTEEEAKNIGKKWNTEFRNNSKYNKVTVKVYFKIDKNIIKFKVKEFNGKTTVLSEDDDFNQVWDKIDMTAENTYIYNMSNNVSYQILDVSNINEAKKYAKVIAELIESQEKYKMFSFVVFVDYRKDLVKITCKNKVSNT